MTGYPHAQHEPLPGSIDPKYPAKFADALDVEKSAGCGDSESGPENSPHFDAALPEEQSSSPVPQKIPFKEQPDSDDPFTYPEGGLRAWLVAFGAFCAMFAGFGILNTIGIFDAYLRNNQLQKESESTVSWIWSIYTFLCFFCGLQIGPVFDAKGPRLLIFGGSVLLILSLMLFGLCTEYWHFILDFSIVAGLGSSLLFTPSIAAVSHFFMERRANATGLAATGGSVGGVVFPLMLQALFPKLGWAWSTRILGFVIVVLCAVANLLVRGRLPQKRKPPIAELLPDFKIFLDGTGALAATTAAVFFAEWGLFVPVTYLPSYAMANGISETFSYQIMAILNAGSFCGRVAAGYAADKIGRFNTIIIVVFFCLASTLCLWLPAHGDIGLVVSFSLIFGFGSGSIISVTPVCVGQLCKTSKYGRYYATSYTVVSFGVLTGIPIAGALIRQVGDYWGVILFTGCCYIVAIACFIFVRIKKAGFHWKVKW